MNYKRLSILLAGVLVALSAMLAVRAYGPRPMSSIESLRDIRWLKESLQLTPVQEADIQRIHQDLAKTLSTCCMKHCQARDAFMESLFAATNGLERSQSLIDEMSDAQAASELATLVNMYRVHEVLTPQQRIIFERQVKAMDCTMRSAGGGSSCRCMSE
ncbi:MAG: Spy/CpxP family protein refolding chaperone [bacterium]